MGLTRQDVWKRPVAEGERRTALRGPGGLLDQLEDPQPQVRRWSVRDLANFPEATRPLLDRLHRETDPVVQEAIFSALLLLGSQQVATGMVSLLQSDDIGLRNNACLLLQEMPAFALPLLPALLQDPDPLIRLFGVRILDHVPAAAALPLLANLIDRESHDSVLMAAVAVAGQLGDATLLSHIQAVMDKPGVEPGVLFAARQAMEHLNPHDSTP